MRTVRPWPLLLGLWIAAACDSAPDPGDADLEAGDADSDVDDADLEDEPPPPCPEEMILIDDGVAAAFCIDRYEHPGRGGMSPTVGVAWFQAREVCVAEAKELCHEQQWVRACLGTDAGACEGVIGPSGLREDCQSDFGVHDMAGNLAEWTAEPGLSISFYVRGGSGEDAEIGCEVREDVDAEIGRTSLGLRCCRRPRGSG